MRLAVNAWFCGQPTTGSGQYTRRLLEYLPRVAPEWTICPLTGLPTGECAGEPAGRFADWRKLWFEQVGFPRACRRSGVDVAHVPYWAPPLQPTVPTVVTIHDLIPLLLREYRGSPLARAYTALVTTTAANAALVLTDSQASRQDILTHLDLPPERVRAIPLAADACFRPQPDPTDAAVRARYGLPDRYVLYLGGLDVRKNVVAALRAYRWAGPLLGSECPLVVAGRLPERDSHFVPDPRRQAGELGLDPAWLCLTGTVAEEDKAALYRGAVALIFPSRYEGFGLPPLEALACGTPVVASCAASLPEVVGDAGVLLEPDDDAGMAGALLQLAQDAAFRGEMSRRALVQAARFSWEQTARLTLAAYVDCVFPSNRV